MSVTRTLLLCTLAGAAPGAGGSAAAAEWSMGGGEASSFQGDRTKRSPVWEWAMFKVSVVPALCLLKGSSGGAHPWGCCGTLLGKGHFRGFAYYKVGVLGCGYTIVLVSWSIESQNAGMDGRQSSNVI